MISEIRPLVDKYALWLKDRTALKEVNDWVEITTPFLDRHNDHLQIYVRREGNAWLLTDDGYIIDDLLSTGTKLDSKKRQELLKMILLGFGIQQDQTRLFVKASETDFPQKKHSLIQAMLAVNDMFALASPVVVSLFLEDVTSWLDLHEIRYVPRVKFTGKMGYDHFFDFDIPKSKVQPERIIKTINHPTRDTADSLVLAWIDTRETRAADSKSYAFLNDGDYTVSTSVTTALENYEIRPVFWSERESVRAELAA